MSSVKSTVKLGVSGKNRNQVQSLLKQNATRVFDNDYFSVYIKAWNGNGTERLEFDPLPASQIGDIYRYPSGTNLNIRAVDGVGKPFLFWHGYDQNLRELSVRVTGSLSFDAIYSGELLSGDSCLEDFTNFPSGNTVLDLGAYSSWWSPKPRLFTAYGVGIEEEFTNWASGEILQTGSFIGESPFLSKFYGTSMSFTTLKLLWAEGWDEYIQFPTGDITTLNNYTLTGNGYIYTGSLFSTFAPNYTQFFDFSSGERDNFPNFYYNFTKEYTTVGATLSPLTGYIKPQYFASYDTFDYASGDRDIFDDTKINYAGDVLHNLSYRISPKYIVLYDTFETYPSGDITNFTNGQVNYLPLGTFSGKILPSGG